MLTLEEIKTMSIEEKLAAVQLLKSAKKSLVDFIDKEDHQLHAVLLRKHSSLEDEVAHLRMKVDSMNRSLKNDTFTYLKYLEWYLDKLLEIRRSKNSPNKTMLLTMELCEKLEEYDFSTFEDNDYD